MIARYSAGTNAGHTIVNQLGKFALHLVPAGIFHGDKTCVIGNGVVIHPRSLIDEIAMLEERGVDTSGLVISDRAHVVMPWHPLLDGYEERLRGDGALGTTGTGTGPAFVDKVRRSGIRVIDLITPALFRRRLESELGYYNHLFARLYDAPPLDGGEILAEYAELGARLRPWVGDAADVVQQAHERGERILLEGAQGALLDLDAGTYPFVTSSVPGSVAGGAPAGIGIGPTAIERVIGVYKAYQTRVGNGPMPTELFDEDAERLRNHGAERGAGEYGTTTGRPRRCGWFDGVLARYTSRLNGVTSVALTRLDTLSGFERVKICVAYELDDRRVSTLPASPGTTQRLRPIYEELPGWQRDVSDVRSLRALPAEARHFVRRIEQILGAPVDMISVGPEREQAIVTRDVFGSAV